MESFKKNSDVCDYIMKTAIPRDRGVNQQVHQELSVASFFLAIVNETLVLVYSQQHLRFSFSIQSFKP